MTVTGAPFQSSSTHSPVPAPTSVEEAVRLINSLVDMLPSSSSFQSADIARQIAEQVHHLHHLRSTGIERYAEPSSSPLEPGSTGPTPSR